MRRLSMSWSFPFSELDAIAQKHKNIKIHYVLEKKPEGAFSGSLGYVTEDLLKKHLPAPSAGNMVFVCGPPPMMKAISGQKNLKVPCFILFKSRWHLTP
jgi:NAD(P)H-flavin reductase